MKQKTTEIKDECIAYFKQNDIWNQVFAGFRDKYLSYGRFAGKVVIKNPSNEDIDELEGFFGQNFHGQKSISISAEKFEKAISNSRYKQISPVEILTEYFGKPLQVRSEIRDILEQKISRIRHEFAEAFKNTPAFSMLGKFEMIAKNRQNDHSERKKDHLRDAAFSDETEHELSEWKSRLWLCARVYNGLPYRQNREMYLAFFAAKITGNPHAFDGETPEGKMLYQIIEADLVVRGQQVETSSLFPAYKRQKSYLLAGILIDDISNYAMLYNVRAIKKDGSFHQGAEGFFQEKDMIQLPLNVISKLSQIQCRNNEIYVVENPSVFAMICDERSCMCMNGQPRLSGLMVLELLAKSGTRVFYSGDLDPEGILIAQKLAHFYPGEFIYWHMTEKDYEVCISGETISQRRIKMLDKITDERLRAVVESMIRCKKAGYQENLIPENSNGSL